ncbi:MAG: S46 family peptidase, partial [Prolixibacteraceae bacterium]|nr:S46 family peptidase [Prolixibacteraceae bacterium]
PDRIAIRDLKLSILKNYMEADAATRIKYSAKYASTSNAWKKWQGEIKGLKRLNAIEVKKKREEDFSIWVNADKNRKYNYGNVLSEFERLYAEIALYQKASDYYDEVIKRGTDIYRLFRHYSAFEYKKDINVDYEKIYLEKHFKNYTKAVDHDVFVTLLSKYKNEINDTLLATSFTNYFEKNTAKKKLSASYSKSILSKPTKLKKVVNKNNAEKIYSKLKKDKLFKLFLEIEQKQNKAVLSEYNRLIKLINKNQQIYVAALIEMNENKMIFPDANQTLRVSYGKVEGFVPADGALYKSYTTLEGIIEKDNPDIYDYDVPDRLKELYTAKDYGRYANSNGELPICFAASNHTTGGNSGSPILDQNGYLVGINFDRCWEGTMSDVMFDPEKCRNISLDMRYMLFLIDKFAGAGYLLDEMKIIE